MWQLTTNEDLVKSLGDRLRINDPLAADCGAWATRDDADPRTIDSHSQPCSLQNLPSEFGSVLGNPGDLQPLSCRQMDLAPTKLSSYLGYGLKEVHIGITGDQTKAQDGKS